MPSHELVVGWRWRFTHITGPSSNPDGLVRAVHGECSGLALLIELFTGRK